MPFSKCQDVIQRISSILDREASFADRMRFHMHLMICSNCRRYYKQFKETSALVSEVLPSDLPDDFEEVMSFVLKETEQPSQPSDLSKII